MQINNLGMPEFKIPDAPKNNTHFGALINKYVQSVNSEGLAAAQAGQNLAIGKTQNVSETILAMQKAEVSFQLLTGIRNKLVEAYREVSRMQV